MHNVTFCSFFSLGSKGQSLHLESVLVLLFILRRSISWLRARGLEWLLPLDRHVHFHKIMGWTICAYSVVHTIGHLANYGKKRTGKRVAIIQGEMMQPPVLLSSGRVPKKRVLSVFKWCDERNAKSALAYSLRCKSFPFPFCWAITFFRGVSDDRRPSPIAGQNYRGTVQCHLFSPAG